MWNDTFNNPRAAGHGGEIMKKIRLTFPENFEIYATCPNCNIPQQVIIPSKKFWQGWRDGKDGFVGPYECVDCKKAFTVVLFYARRVYSCCWNDGLWVPEAGTETNLDKQIMAKVPGGKWTHQGQRIWALHNEL